MTRLRGGVPVSRGGVGGEGGLSTGSLETNLPAVSNNPDNPWSGGISGVSLVAGRGFDPRMLGLWGRAVHQHPRYEREA